MASSCGESRIFKMGSQIWIIEAKEVPEIWPPGFRVENLAGVKQSLLPENGLCSRAEKVNSLAHMIANSAHITKFHTMPRQTSALRQKSKFNYGTAKMFFQHSTSTHCYIGVSASEFRWVTRTSGLQTLAPSITRRSLLVNPAQNRHTDRHLFPGQPR